MRIYNESKDKVINRIEITLTKKEAEDFYYRINDLANNPKIRDDVVFGNLTKDVCGILKYQQAIYMALYNDENIKSFPERVRKIILKDK